MAKHDNGGIQVTEKELTLIQKLIEIQSTIKVPKSQYSDYGGYSYRSCEDILKAVKPANAKHGLLLQLTDVPYFYEGRFYIKSTASLTDGKDSIEVEGYAREMDSKPKMDDSQVTGSASSYARKYALNGLYLIDDGNDSDALNSEETQEDGLRGEFLKVFNDNIQMVSDRTGTLPEILEANILGKNGFDSLDDVTADFYAQIVGYSKAMLMKANQRANQNQEPKQQSARDLFKNGGRQK